MNMRADARCDATGNGLAVRRREGENVSKESSGFITTLEPLAAEIGEAFPKMGLASTMRTGRRKYNPKDETFALGHSSIQVQPVTQQLEVRFRKNPAVAAAGP
jgi:hypothetical protein